MIVTGAVGLSAHGNRATAGLTVNARKVVCAWRSAKGGMRSKPFLVTQLEVVHDAPEAGK